MWRKNQTDFHQMAVNPLLAGFWASLLLSKPSRIFVPLCGKSLDLLWLARQGNEVVGVELSPVAVKAFFTENGLAPRKSKQGKFTVWEDGRLKILCGDFFSLELADLGEIDVVYDRAALTALPESIRKQYVAQMRAIVPVSCRIFLLTVEDWMPAQETPLLQASGDEVDAEIKMLYGKHFLIDTAHKEVAWESDLASPGDSAIAVLHKVYRLTPRH
jgi:thiopurine S-methyltransferase